MRDAGTSEDVRATIWQYVDLLTQHARVWAVYRRVPASMLSKVGSLAAEITSTTGESPEAIDFTSLANRAMQLSENLDEKELNELRENLMSDKTLVPQVLSMLSNVQGQTGSTYAR